MPTLRKDILELVEEEIGCEVRYEATTKGGEYSSPCPWCGGTDRFRIWPEEDRTGRFWCRVCGRYGDGITFLRLRRCTRHVDACRILGVPPKASKRRYGGQSPNSRERVPGDRKKPNKKWIEAASKFIEKCHRELLSGNQSRTIKWLAHKYGLSEDSIKKFHIGYNPFNLLAPKIPWGVDDGVNQKDDREYFPIPTGLVIPVFRRSLWNIDYRAPLRIRVRRIRGKGKSKYQTVSGSVSNLMELDLEHYVHHSDYPDFGSRFKDNIVVVESELDAMLVSQKWADMGGILGLGTANAKPDRASTKILLRAKRVLIATDFDDAGRKAADWWESNFPNAKYWPVPKGKDPSEYWRKGGKISEWVEAGLR